ncbi:hypothetical protein R3P38DRAFT_2744745 [Favolaschia claudopus]|uniref:F-box domain-containing protein n=1 Tax=Favolaschia claudopus TaxID=2862362 RepID=A0AAV9ZHI9_9AGAR
MVLTRRAASAAKSIIRWLPNEILATIIQGLPVADLYAISLASRLLRNIATPFLYRCVHLSTSSKLRLLIRTMKQRTGASLSLHVRHFIPPDNDDNVNMQYKPSIVKELTTVLTQFSRLEALDLFCTTAVDFSQLLEQARFPQLTVFQYTLGSEASSLVASFLNRHKTLKVLSLLESQACDLHGPIHLPHLHTLNLPHNYYASFVLDDVQLESVTLMVYNPHFDFEPTWRVLGASPRLTTVEILCGVHHFDDAAELGNIAKHLPHIHTLSVGRPASGLEILSLDDSNAIVLHLTKFSSLHSLDLDSQFNVTYFKGIEDEVRRWSGACKTLVEIAIAGDQWNWDKEKQDWVHSPRA